MPHEVHTDTVYPHNCYCAGDKSILIVLLLPGNVCSSFSIWTSRQPQNGRFWLSAGLEYLPSGIPGLAAAAAATLPTLDRDPFSTSSHQSIISRRWQRTTFPPSANRVKSTAIYGFLQFMEELSSNGLLDNQS